MIEGLDHIAIAVHDFEAFEAIFRDVLGLEHAGREEIPSQKVEVSFFKAGEAKIELLRPTADDSPISKFLEKKGPGVHHLAFSVSDIAAALAVLEAGGVKPLDKTPRDGAHGTKIAFLHPSSTGKILVELIQKPAAEK